MTKPIPTHDGHTCTVCWQLLHHNIIITSLVLNKKLQAREHLVHYIDF